MPDSSHSLYRILTWILLLTVIGLYALYHWYTGILKQDIENQGAQAALSARRLSEADSRLQRAADTERDLNAQIAAARSELESLAARHREATEQVQAHAAAVEQHKQALAEAAERERGLNAKLESAAQTQSELETAHRAAKERIAALEGELEQLSRTLADNEARYAQQARELEQRLSERAEHLRVALEGSDPERARVMSGLEQSAEQQRLARVKAEETLESTRTQGESALASLRSEAESALASAKAEAERLLAETRAALEGQLAEVKRAADAAAAAHASEIQAAEVKLAGLRTELESERRALAELQQTHERTQAELTQAQQALEAANTELGDAAETRKTLEGQMAAAQERIATLESELTEARNRADSIHQADLAATRQALAQTRGLFARYSELGGQQTERGMRLRLGDEELHFPKGTAVLPKGNLASLDRIAALLKEHPKLTARIEGHTDSGGPEEINQSLSEQRAQAVLKALVARGVAADRLVAQGLGESSPFADNATPAGRRQNRRVEIYMIEPAP